MRKALSGYRNSFVSVVASATFLAAATLAPNTANAACTNTNVSSCGILDVADLGLEEDNLRGDGLYVINIRDCRSLIEDNPSITLEWRLDSGVSTEDYGIKVSNADVQCNAAVIGADTGDDNGCRVFAKDQITASGNTFRRSFNIADLLQLDSVDSCDDSALDDNEIRVDFIFQDQNNGEGTSTTAQKGSVTFRLATTRPAAPQIDSVSAGGATLEVDWTPLEDDSVEYRVYFSENPIASGAEPESLSGARSAGPTADGSLSISSNIVENRLYYVGVVTIDSALNESVLSDIIEAETIPTSDFFERYREQGGGEEGGYCSAGGNSAAGASMFGLALLGLLGLRRRRALLVLAPLALLALPTTADAQHLTGVDLELNYETPITSALEIRFSPFEPAIDDEFEGVGPYAEVFGDRNPWNMEFEYDYQFYRGIGSLAVSGEFGFVRVSGRSVDSNGVRSPDKTRFSRVPLRLGLVYRFDYLQTRYNVPFVVALKAGLDYHLWRTKGPDGLSESIEGDETFRARGATHGWHAGFALHLLLDWFAPGMARGFDSSVGVNNSYIFGEYRIESIDDFGDEKSWDLSSTSFVFGLAFEF